MLYPVYVFPGDAKHAYGAVFPDFPGCNAAADELQELPGAINEAVRAHFGFDGDSIPEATPLDQVQAATKDDDLYTGGFWMLVDIDLQGIRSKPVRVNISMPESLLERIDQAAERRHMTRSGFLASAAARLLEEA